MNHKPHRGPLEAARPGRWYDDTDRVARPMVVTQCPHALWWGAWIRYWD